MCHGLMYAHMESYLILSFTFDLLFQIERKGTVYIHQYILVKLSNSWYKKIKTVKYYTFPTCLWGFDGNFVFFYSNSHLKNSSHVVYQVMNIKILNFPCPKRSGLRVWKYITFGCPPFFDWTSVDSSINMGDRTDTITPIY